MRRIVSQTYLFVYQSSLLYDLIKLLIKSENHEIFIYCLIILVFTESQKKHKHFCQLQFIQHHDLIRKFFEKLKLVENSPIKVFFVKT